MRRRFARRSGGHLARARLPASQRPVRPRGRRAARELAHRTLHVLPRREAAGKLGPRPSRSALLRCAGAALRRTNGRAYDGEAGNFRPGAPAPLASSAAPAHRSLKRRNAGTRVPKRCRCPASAGESAARRPNTSCGAISKALRIYRSGGKELPQLSAPRLPRRRTARYDAGRRGLRGGTACVRRFANRRRTRSAARRGRGPEISAVALPLHAPPLPRRRTVRCDAGTACGRAASQSRRVLYVTGAAPLLRDAPGPPRRQSAGARLPRNRRRLRFAARISGSGNHGEPRRQSTRAQRSRSALRLPRRRNAREDAGRRARVRRRTNRRSAARVFDPSTPLCS